MVTAWIDGLFGCSGFDPRGSSESMTDRDLGDSIPSGHDTNHALAKGRLIQRAMSILFMLPAWFAPHTRLRVFFHRLRGAKIGNNVETVTS